MHLSPMASLKVHHRKYLAYALQRKYQAIIKYAMKMENQRSQTLNSRNKFTYNLPFYLCLLISNYLAKYFFHLMFSFFSAYGNLFWGWIGIPEEFQLYFSEEVGHRKDNAKYFLRLLKRYLLSHLHSLLISQWLPWGPEVRSLNRKKLQHFEDLCLFSAWM